MGHYERGLVAGELSRISRFSRTLENCPTLLCLPHSGGSLESLNSLESLELGHSSNTAVATLPSPYRSLPGSCQGPEYRKSLQRVARVPEGARVPKVSETVSKQSPES